MSFKAVPTTDIIWALVILAWILFVVEFLSKQVAKRVNVYITRKFIHIFAGGLPAALAPLLFKTPYPIIVICSLLFLNALYPHIQGKEKGWYQIKDNYGDVYFCFSYLVLFTLFWKIDLNIAVAAALFVALGDGVTGVIRSYTRGKREKDWFGSLGMLLTCLPIGYLYCGLPGIAGAVAATFFEAPELFLSRGKVTKPTIDDNIIIPLGSAAVIYLLKYLI